jgi:hypothetical protein
MSRIVKDDSFELVGEFVRPDAKKRITLGSLAAASKVVYQVYQNRLGQIVLDPVKPIPAYESWLYENPAALASVRQGLQESAEGKRIYRGSFQDAEE